MGLFLDDFIVAFLKKLPGVSFTNSLYGSGVGVNNLISQFSQ